MAHSRGGPGSMSTWVPSAWKATPGAVPQSLSSTVHPSGTMACWKLFSVTGVPRWANRSRIRWAEGSWYTSSFPKAWATATLVRSSQVGPRPPVVMRMSARPRAMSTAWRTRWGLSPTTVW